MKHHFPYDSPGKDGRTPDGVERYRLDGRDLRPLLVILHQESSTTGRVGQVLQRHGVRLDIRRPVLGDPLPETLENHHGAIVFGGPPSVNDGLPYLDRETDWLAVPLREEKPFLGICLGAQMLARHLGAKVGSHAEGLSEIGYYPLRATEAGRSFISHWPDMVYQWHTDGFELPAGAELLAEGDWYPNQAFRYGRRAFAVQFHAELTMAMVYRWTTKGHERLKLPGAQPRRDHFHGRRVHDEPVRQWLDTFLTKIFGDTVSPD
ncbi:glutamine amidotransferase [Fulvimarina sp. 2208YS6-2-32]|uniref:Glutamine amidotransferase n=1 Tax=Fulvimarina uroteuthidis TaxID=3098149 RepID=A0ABU5I0A8_9HYPH|nr:glutamine amidotransferase [Fulvimarina sp. 2208YS6-2-32]MDY8108408.1 glutamine amidotransferase [Fulvimarina sp. 2208YS6-2-32]